ncbi:MAG: rod-binding protein [Alphaproteobacteria bacterium]
MDVQGTFTSAALAVRQGENPLATLKAGGDAAAAAQDFEAFYLSQMLGYMFAGVSTDGPFGGGPGEAVFKSLLIQEYGGIMARGGGLGLSDALTREILKLQEGQG